MLSALAGTARRRQSATRAAALYWASISPESTPGSAARNGGQPVGAGRVEVAVDPPFGHRGQVGEGDGEEVGDVAERGAVEVAARRHPAVGKDHRVVDGAGQLAVDDGAGVVEGVAAGADHLGGAAQRVGVLDPGVVDAGARRRRRSRPGRPACWPPTRPDRGGAAGRPVRAGRPGRSRAGLRPTWPPPPRRCAAAGRCRRRPGRDGRACRRCRWSGPGPLWPRGRAGPARRPPGRRPRPRSGRPAPSIDLAFPDQGQGHVRQRGQVAAAAERAVLADDRRDPGVEQGRPGPCTSSGRIPE